MQYYLDRKRITGDRGMVMTVSGFIDESGKFRDHKIICIGCVAAFNEHVHDFAQEWGRLLRANGMKNFHANKALKHHVPWEPRLMHLAWKNGLMP